MTEHTRLSTEPFEDKSPMHRDRSLRRRFVWMLPAVFITYSLAYLDRSNFGFGAAAGMARKPAHQRRQSRFSGAVFFLGYFSFQIPGALLAQRIGVGTPRLLVSLICWGILASLTGVIRWFLAPGHRPLLPRRRREHRLPRPCSLLTRWFTRAERSRANTFLILGNPITVLWMSALTGFSSSAFGWQKTFILEGLPSIIWALVWLALVRDRPRDASWLTQRRAYEPSKRELAKEQVGTRPRPGLGARPSLRRDVLLLSLQYFCWSLGVYGFVLWLPTIIRSHDDQHPRSGRQSTGPAHRRAIRVCGRLHACLCHSRPISGCSACVLVWPFLLIGGASPWRLCSSSDTSFYRRLRLSRPRRRRHVRALRPFFAIIPDRIPADSGGVMALINSCGALGGFARNLLRRASAAASPEVPRRVLLCIVLRRPLPPPRCSSSVPPVVHTHRREANDPDAAQPPRLLSAVLETDAALFDCA